MMGTCPQVLADTMLTQAFLTCRFGHQSCPPPLSSSGGSSGSSRMGLQEEGMEAGAGSAGASVAASQALAAGVAVELTADLGVSDMLWTMWPAHLCLSHDQAHDA